MSDSSSVTVAVRIRPLVPSETARGCQEILEIYQNLNQIKIKTSEKAFTFNHVCDHSISQKDFYDTCVKSLIGNLFKGYNVTILAYGQTGSGKTHSMGTSYNGDDNVGIIPRAVREIFDFIKDNFGYEFSVSVSFIEIYQEVVYDLLANKAREQCSVEIREDVKGIIIPGLTEELVKTPQEALEFLTKGSQGRAMASTNMNSQSSRSHAIYTINIGMQKKGDSNQNKTARFHLVDLAGSERQKKTGATGQTFKEGVNINKGLLALGNVISALGDEKTQNNYICYRDSNLTRLLKDSLGGNSITLMIACVSPADYNLEESLSTLRYADRARKIKNKPIINQDPKAAEINKLQKVIQQLRLELVGQGGPSICPAEMELLKKELNEAKTKCRLLNIQLGSTLNENGILHEKLHMVDLIPELMNKLKEIIDEYNSLLAFNENSGGDIAENNYYKEKAEKFKPLLIQLSDIHTEQIKIIRDITKQETETYLEVNDSQSEHELSEHQEGHTAQQLALNNEFQEVRRQLAMKEKLVKCMESNTMFIDPNIITECESKISTLEKEKEELLQQLKNVQINGPSKISENRRKRVQGLEEEIQDLKRKVIEHEKLLKHKKSDEEKIRKLNGEILTMKQSKVSLMRKIRQESDRFRTWKLQKERDLLKLKEQDRKKQNQILKMEMIHARQQNVLKRKVEEAAAVNKRLKDSLAKRKMVVDKRQGKNEKIGEWIQQEVELYVNILEAEATIPNLIEDRANLQKQLDFLKSNSDLEDDENINQISEEVQLRTAQITDLQQKLLDSQEDVRSQTRFDNIQSMLEAKHALKALFDLVAEIKHATFAVESKVQDQNRDIENIKNQNVLLEHKIKESEQAKCELVQEYEEKMLLLLGHGDIESKDDQLKECIEIQKKTIQMLELKESQLKVQVEKLTETVQKDMVAKTLDVTFEKPMQQKKKILNFKIKEDEIHYHENDDNNQENDETDQEKHENNIGTPQNVVNKIKETRVQINLFTPDFEPEDNVLNDPDWHKTPLGRKLKANQEVLDKPKRTSEGGCSCKTNCASRNCGCRKSGKPCDHRCKCSATKCTYRQADNQNASTAPIPEDDGDDFLHKTQKLNDDKRVGRIKRQKILKQEMLRL